MGLFGKSKTVLAVDAAALLKSRGVRGRAAPRQQLQVLRMLSRVMQREKIDLTAVLSGKPLDKAPHNGKFDDMRVRYAKDETAVSKEMTKALKQAGSGGVLVTDDIELEKSVIQSGGITLRLSTFRKLLEDGGETAVNSGDGSGRSSGGNRRPRRRKNTKPSSPEEPKQEKESKDDTISQMIDLVD